MKEFDDFTEEEQDKVEEVVGELHDFTMGKFKELTDMGLDPAVCYGQLLSGSIGSLLFTGTPEDAMKTIVETLPAMLGVYQEKVEEMSSLAQNINEAFKDLDVDHGQS